MSDNSSNSDKKDNTADYMMLAQANHTPDETLSFDELDGFQSILAVLMMALGFMQPENSPVTENLGEMMGDDNFSAYIAEEKSKGSSHKEAAQNYKGYTQPGLKEFAQQPAKLIFESGDNNFLHPTLIDKMQKNPQVANYVNISFDAARQEGINPYIFTNQLWQESRFVADAEGPEREVNGVIIRARGIGQFIPSTGAKYGLNTPEDFNNAEKSIRSSAKFNSYLTNVYGDQGLVLVAYNAGGVAIKEYQPKYGNDITIGEWVGEMRHQNIVRGAPTKEQSHLWRAETLGYVEAIDPRFWSEELKQEARTKMAEFNANNNSSRFNTVAQDVNAPAFSADNPSPLLITPEVETPLVV